VSNSHETSRFSEAHTSHSAPQKSLAGRGGPNRLKVRKPQSYETPSFTNRGILKTGIRSISTLMPTTTLPLQQQLPALRHQSIKAIINVCDATVADWLIWRGQHFRSAGVCPWYQLKHVSLRHRRRRFFFWRRRHRRRRESTSSTDGIRLLCFWIGRIRSVAKRRTVTSRRIPWQRQCV